jgi:hypothetical protein
VTEPTKYCSKCHKHKRLSQFHKNKASSDGLGYACKACVSLASTYKKKATDIPPLPARPSCIPIIARTDIVEGECSYCDKSCDRIAHFDSVDGTPLFLHKECAGQIQTWCLGLEGDLTIVGGKPRG